MPLTPHCSQTPFALGDHTERGGLLSGVKSLSLAQMGLPHATGYSSHFRHDPYHHLEFDVARRLLCECHQLLLAVRDRVLQPQRPGEEVRMMIAHFADFRLWLDVVDALWRRLPPTYELASGPALACSDSEVITMPLWAGAVAGHRDPTPIACIGALRRVHTSTTTCRLAARCPSCPPPHAAAPA
jgi:hypothetical protein